MKTNGSWDDLRFFMAFARSRSLHLAAAELRLSESTLRRHLFALQSYLGASLFESSGGAWRLTAEGTRLHGAIQAAEQTIEGAVESLRGADSRLEGHVKVSCGEALGSLRIAPILAKWQSQSPGITIELITLSRNADLTKHEVDIALIAVQPEAEGDHRIRSLGPVTYKLYASVDYLTGRPPISSVECLTAHRFVGNSDSVIYSAAIRRAAAAAGLGMAPHFSSSGVIAQARAIAAGAGVGLLPTFAVEPHLGLQGVLHDQVSLHFPIWLMVHAGAASLARVRAVADVIAALFPVED